jgi:autotransporter-associated beta strand protein
MTHCFLSSRPHWHTLLTACLLCTACASGGQSRRPSTTAPSNTKHPADIYALTSTVSGVMNDRKASPPPNNTYSHETAYGPGQIAAPRVYLTPSEDFAALASTDCSGWVSFVLNTVSPLHQAVLDSQRRLPEYNQAYEDGFELDEAGRTWPRAFVLTNYFRSEHAKRTGFDPVQRYDLVEVGDVAAYAMGRYTDPSDSTRQKPKDTGHAFIVAGAPYIVDPETPNYDGNGTLSRRAAKVVGVPVIDASSTPHFDPDSRKNDEGGFSLPTRPPYQGAKAGGIGVGTIWFVLDRKDRVVQRRIGPDTEYYDVIIGAGRLRNRIELIPEILDDEGNLIVEIFTNSPSEYGDAIYGGLPVDLTGEGGVRLLGGGRLVLNGQSDFSGGVTVDSGELVVDSATALGTGDVQVRGGKVKLNHAAIADDASLRLADTVQDGAIHLGFEGSDQVHSLEVGDKVYRCGTWGGIGSKAEFIDPRLSGRGMLELTAEPSSECTAGRSSPSASLSASQHP